MSAPAVAPVTPADRPWIRELLRAHWGAPEIVSRGRVLLPETLPGFLARVENERAGLITYELRHGDLEIVTLNSLRDGVGVGTALVHAALAAARAAGCGRAWLVTTNDNLPALGFYQRRGFELVAVHRRALARSRQLKPSIPLVGLDGIPLRDELELEIALS